jgi:hypothetical protein
MPGRNKYASIRSVRQYRALKRLGYSKAKSAKITNYGKTHADRSRMAKKAARTRRSRGRRR